MTNLSTETLSTVIGGGLLVWAFVPVHLFHY